MRLREAQQRPDRCQGEPEDAAERDHERDLEEEAMMTVRTNAILRMR
jgi:hypothetical protein